MIGIYQDSFIDYLQKNLGGKVEVKARNIVCRCPWCDIGVTTSKNHLWISAEVPMWHCFRAGCKGKSGMLDKLLKKIEGRDISNKFIDQEKIKEISTKKIEFSSKKNDELKPLILPEIDEDKYFLKTLYLKKRLRFSNIDIKNIKGLFFDINQFLDVNKIPIDVRLSRIRDYLHSNFIGIITENNNIAFFRNIDPQSSFPHFKLQLRKSHFLDYYKLDGQSIDSNNIILGEGIFTIYSEHIYNTLGLKQLSRLYACGLSFSYLSLLKSIAFHEQIFRMNVVILSDSNIHLEDYRKIKRWGGHIINKLDVYYNKNGEDFNDLPVVPEKFVI